MESLGFSPQNHSRFLSELHTHVHMFAVTTTPTSLSSSATRSLKNNKASSLSKRTKCSSIVVSSSSSSSSSKMDEKFDRREMLKNALVASVGVVATTPMPVSSFVRLVLPMISKRVFMYFVVFRLDHQKAEKETTRKRVRGFDLSLFSLVSRTRKVRKRSKNVLTKRFFFKSNLTTTRRSRCSVSAKSRTRSTKRTPRKSSTKFAKFWTFRWAPTGENSPSKRRER